MALQTWALKNGWIIKMGGGSTIRVCYPQTDLQKKQISVEAGGGGGGGEMSGFSSPLHDSTGLEF